MVKNDDEKIIDISFAINLLTSYFGKAVIILRKWLNFFDVGFNNIVNNMVIRLKKLFQFYLKASDGKIAIFLHRCFSFLQKSDSKIAILL